MMGLHLEVFETDAPSKDAPSVVLDAIAFEEAKLTAYDKGYRAGWEDAAQAQSDEQNAMSAELARNLKSLGFTLAEARDHVLQSIRPLLQEMVGQLLPELARETLMPLALQVLLPLADAAADAPIDIVIHPSGRAYLEPLLAQTGNLPVTIIDEPSLSENQAYLRLGTVETRIDLNQAIDEIAAAVRNFYNLPERMSDHG